jgi:hypothetical protein
MRGPPSGRRRAPRCWSAGRTGSRSTIDLGGLFAPRIGQHAGQRCARERGRASWAKRLEAPRFLADGKRFIWTSERADFRNFYLYDLGGKQLARLTRNAFDMVDIVRVDEAIRLALVYGAVGRQPHAGAAASRAP